MSNHVIIMVPKYLRHLYLGSFNGFYPDGVISMRRVRRYGGMRVVPCFCEGEVPKSSVSRRCEERRQGRIPETSHPEVVLRVRRRGIRTEQSRAEPLQCLRPPSKQRTTLLDLPRPRSSHAQLIRSAGIQGVSSAAQRSAVQCGAASQ